jgi:glycosyltransferase involved in cell wall biosynthesis
VNDERRALLRARVVIANSERTKRDVVERVGVRADCVHTIYCGIDADRFRPSTAAERAAARATLGLPQERVTVAFVGPVGDRRKGFDTVFAAWKALCADPTWDADLAVVGAGADVSGWVARAWGAKLASRIRFLGFREDMPAILAACDALVAPARYEAYGLAVQEALCCGLAALVSTGAGVAERYPPELHHLLIPDPEDSVDLADRLRTWRRQAERDRAAVASLSQVLRACTWERMAAAVARILETAA